MNRLIISLITLFVFVGCQPATNKRSTSPAGTNSTDESIEDRNNNQNNEQESNQDSSGSFSIKGRVSFLSLFFSKALANSEHCISRCRTNQCAYLFVLDVNKNRTKICEASVDMNQEFDFEFSKFPSIYEGKILETRVQNNRGQIRKFVSMFERELNDKDQLVNENSTQKAEINLDSMIRTIKDVLVENGLTSVQQLSKKQRESFETMMEREQVTEEKTCDFSSINRSCQVAGGNGEREVSCIDGIPSIGRCELISCNEPDRLINGRCVAPTCVGNSEDMCVMENGLGKKTRTCINGAWTSYGSCQLVSCARGYEPVNGQCQKKTCEGPSQVACTVGFGSGVQNRRCVDGNWQLYGGCQLNTCESGYRLTANTCVEKTCVGEYVVSCQIEDGQGKQRRKCVKGDWVIDSPCETVLCDEGYEKNLAGECVEKTCDGESEISCSIPYGVGKIQRVCNQGNWVNVSSCLAVSCQASHEISGGECVPKTCAGESTISCSIDHGVGQKERTCNGGSWTEPEACQVVSCEDNYEISTDGLSCQLVSSPGGDDYSLNDPQFVETIASTPRKPTFVFTLNPQGVTTELKLYSGNSCSNTANVGYWRGLHASQFPLSPSDDLSDGVHTFSVKAFATVNGQEESTICFSNIINYELQNGQVVESQFTPEVPVYRSTTAPNPKKPIFLLTLNPKNITTEVRLYSGDNCRSESLSYWRSQSSGDFALQVPNELEDGSHVFSAKAFVSRGGVIYSSECLSSFTTFLVGQGTQPDLNPEELKAARFMSGCTEGQSLEQCNVNRRWVDLGHRPTGHLLGLDDAMYGEKGEDCSAWLARKNISYEKVGVHNKYHDGSRQHFEIEKENIRAPHVGWTYKNIMRPDVCVYRLKFGNSPVEICRMAPATNAAQALGTSNFRPVANCTDVSQHDNASAGLAFVEYNLHVLRDRPVARWADLSRPMDVLEMPAQKEGPSKVSAKEWLKSIGIEGEFGTFNDYRPAADEHEYLNELNYVTQFEREFPITIKLKDSFRPNMCPYRVKYKEATQSMCRYLSCDNPNFEAFDWAKPLLKCEGISQHDDISKGKLIARMSLNIKSLTRPYIEEFDEKAVSLAGLNIYSHRGQKDQSASDYYKSWGGDVTHLGTKRVYMDAAAEQVKFWADARSFTDSYTKGQCPYIYKENANGEEMCRMASCTNPDPNQTSQEFYPVFRCNAASNWNETKHDLFYYDVAVFERPLNSNDQPSGGVSGSYQDLGNLGAALTPADPNGVTYCKDWLKANDINVTKPTDVRAFEYISAPDNYGLPKNANCAYKIEYIVDGVVQDMKCEARGWDMIDFQGMFDNPNHGIRKLVPVPFCDISNSDGGFDRFKTNVFIQ